MLNAAAVDGSENKIEPLDDANLSKSDWLKRAQHTKQNSKQDKEELLDLLKSFQSSPLVDSALTEFFSNQNYGLKAKTTQREIERKKISKEIYFDDEDVLRKWGSWNATPLNLPLESVEKKSTYTKLLNQKWG